MSGLNYFLSVQYKVQRRVSLLHQAHIFTDFIFRNVYYMCLWIMNYELLMQVYPCLWSNVIHWRVKLCVTKLCMGIVALKILSMLPHLPLNNKQWDWEYVPAFLQCTVPVHWTVFRVQWLVTVLQYQGREGRTDIKLWWWSCVVMVIINQKQMKRARDDCYPWDGRTETIYTNYTASLLNNINTATTVLQNRLSSIHCKVHWQSVDIMMLMN